MPTKKIYIVRHGQTDYNKNGIVQGSGVDTDLNETGLQQASYFHKKYQSISFEKIYISALKRTQQTIQKFIDDGIPFEKHVGLNEINWGNKEGQKISIKEHEDYLKMMESWNKGELHLKQPGGESPLELIEKQKKVIEIIEKSPEETILICTHGRAMRILIAYLVYNDICKMETLLHDNTSLYVLEYNGKGYEILLNNDRSHLTL